MAEENGQDERLYQDEVDYDEEEEEILDEDMIEDEVDDDDGMDGEIAVAGATTAMHSLYPENALSASIDSSIALKLYVTISDVCRRG